LPGAIAQALVALDYLDDADQSEIKVNLATPHKHLPAVEELLWLRGWKAQTGCRRGGNLLRNKDVDWFFKSQSNPVFLEAKFRPSDWPMLADRGTYRPIKGGLLKNAANKFPLERTEGALHLVGITGPSHQDEWYVHAFGSELEDYPQIDAVVYRSLISMTHVLSTSVSAASKVIEMLATLKVDALPINYFVPFLGTARETRIREREAQGTPSTPRKSAVVCRALKPEFYRSVPVLPEGFYRMNVKGHTLEGEPLLEVVPRVIDG